jgi:aspartyl-tRNA(Asn)/glutamyl-tRNA(Gln) amidotransferase subunit A
LPAGLDDDGLPVAVQVMGRPCDEATVLRVGQAYESVSDTVGRLAPL